jgi:hypothetical protein
MIPSLLPVSITTNVADRHDVDSLRNNPPSFPNRKSEVTPLAGCCLSRAAGIDRKKTLISTQGKISIFVISRNARVSIIKMKSRADCRLISMLLLLTGLVSLSGCHRLTLDQRVNAWVDSGGKSVPTYLTSEEIKRIEERRYGRVLGTTLAERVFWANGEGLRGSVKLRMKLDRQGDVLRCEAQPTDAGSPPGFTKLVTDVCWSSIWESVPEGLQNPIDGTFEVTAPLIASGNTSPISDYDRRHQRADVESRFFWNNVVAKQSINAFGKARFEFTANAKGQVTHCDVTLKKHYLRPERFHSDPALQKVLATQCLQLDLQQMSGFRVREDGVAHRVVFVEYLPWKKQVGKYSE